MDSLFKSNFYSYHCKMFKKGFSLFVFIILSASVYSQSISMCSWNLKNFGKSKTDAEIEQIADLVKNYDVVALQEIVTSYGGAQAVARLAGELNRKGTKWDYVISDPTVSSPYRSERYAFLWKTNKLKKVGDAWLEKKYEQEIEREPYFIRLNSKGKTFTLVNFHAVPKKMQPETEIKFFKFLPSVYPKDNLIFCGDFNLPQSHTVFNPLKTLGYLPVLKKQKTSLRQKCIAGDCLASEYDNIFYDAAKIHYLTSGIIPFYTHFEDIKQARLLSDHVPVFFKFMVR